MPLTANAALDPDRIIGRDGSLPWRLPEDLRLFKRLTLGHPIIMGRKTWESLPRQPLPGRLNIVVSRQPDYIARGAEVVPSPAALATLLDPESPAFLIGGATLYELLLPNCAELVLTHIHQRHPGDARFPDYIATFEPVETLAETTDFTTVRYRRTAPGDLRALPQAS